MNGQSISEAQVCALTQGFRKKKVGGGGNRQGIIT